MYSMYPVFHMYHTNSFPFYHEPDWCVTTATMNLAMGGLHKSTKMTTTAKRKRKSTKTTTDRKETHESVQCHDDPDNGENINIMKWPQAHMKIICTSMKIVKNAK